jgi:hypothetical protein
MGCIASLKASKWLSSLKKEGMVISVVSAETGKRSLHIRDGSVVLTVIKPIVRHAALRNSKHGPKRIEIKYVRRGEHMPKRIAKEFANIGASMIWNIAKSDSPTSTTMIRQTAQEKAIAAANTTETIRRPRNGIGELIENISEHIQKNSASESEDGSKPTPIKSEPQSIADEHVSWLQKACLPTPNGRRSKPSTITPASAAPDANP